MATDDRDLTEAPEAATPAGEPGPPRSRPIALLVLLLALLVSLTVVIAYTHQKADDLRESASAENDALVDVSETNQVVSQISDALEKVYTYNFSRLDENEQASRSVITGDFVQEFDTLFKQVRDLAPQQQAVVSATVTAAGVQMLDGGWANVVAFADQRAARGSDGQQAIAPLRLIVRAHKVDGTWKIAGVESR